MYKYGFLLEALKQRQWQGMLDARCTDEDDAVGGRWEFFVAVLGLLKLGHEHTKMLLPQTRVIA